MKRALLSGLLAFVLFAWGCSPPSQIVVHPPSDIPRETHTLSSLTQEAEARSAAVEGLLHQGPLREEDRAAISGLASAYRATAELGSHGRPDPDFLRALKALLKGLAQMEASALSRKDARAAEPAAVMSLHRVKEREILDAYAAGDHRGVIRRCEDFKALFGTEGFLPELSAVFAASLAREGKLREAIVVAGAILREMEARPGALSVGADLAQWHLQAGEGEKAIRTYQRVVERHEHQGAILQSLGEKLAMKDAPSAPRIPVDGKIGSESRPEHEEVRIGAVSEQEKGLADARRLMDEERYQEALSVLDLLAAAEGAGGGRDVGELREKAVEGLIERERNRAARLFLAARQTTDPEQKDKYLRASYDILQSLVEKYPASPLITKVRAHRERVREELERR